jgi:hypothetical protein
MRINVTTHLIMLFNYIHELIHRCVDSENTWPQQAGTHVLWGQITGTRDCPDRINTWGQDPIMLMSEIGM